MTYSMTLIIDPVAKARPRVAHGHAYTPKRTQEYESSIALWTHHMKFNGAVSLDVSFIMPMPKSWSKKKRAAMNGKPHTARPDIDNLVKALMDGMICLKDDCTVYAVRADKKYGERGEVRIVASDDKYCRDCVWYCANHCFHPEFYPIQLNKKLYDDDRYTHEGVCACALFEQRDRDDD